MGGVKGEGQEEGGRAVAARLPEIRADLFFLPFILTPSLFYFSANCSMTAVLPSGIT